jgi:predicted nucleic acid-binding Zn ribbon protein
MEQKLCLDCGTALRGRADKKFCDDQCRNNYNNKLKAEDNSFVKQVNRILARNRTILKTLNPEGKIKVQRDILAKAGFDFDYFTHHYTTQNANKYIFCYEYGYLPLEKNEVLLVKRE